MLRGAGELIDVCQHRIHHDPLHLSEDGDFSWEEVECLGACVNAPMVMVWSDTYEDLTKESFGKLIDGFAAGTPPKAGSQIGRQFAAPEGGARVLKDGGAVSRRPEAAAPKEPALADAEPKKQTESANVQERPAPKPPADDATRKGKT
jgi:NADH-quinone oxidoreductase subunit E